MAARDAVLTPEEYGRRLAALAPPIGPEQARAAARILASVTHDDVDNDAA